MYFNNKFHLLNWFALIATNVYVNNVVYNAPFIKCNRIFNYPGNFINIANILWYVCWVYVYWVMYFMEIETITTMLENYD